MFDLNLSIGSNWKENFEEGKSTVAVTTTSSVVNGEEGSSNNGTWSTVTRATPENSYTFNFGILRRNDPVEKDRYLTEPEQVTRELFPVSGLSEYMNMGRPNNNNGNGNWIDQRVVPRKLVQQQHQQVQHVKPKKSRRGPPSRSSQYRGVTFYRRTGRWESHIWDCGKQIYLGGFDTALAAARAYDRAAIKFRGVDADINFNLREYEEEINQMKSLSKEELVHILRRGSTGFTRGCSKYKGVRWEAQMEQFHGKKAYNKAAVQCNGRDAVTNFEPSKYGEESTSEPQNEGIVGSKYDTNYAGSQHDLDLNLGISNSSPKENESESLALLQFQPYDVQNARKSKLQMDPPLPLLTSEYPTSLAGLNPNCFSFYEEKGAEKRIEVSQGLPEWGWRVDGGATPMAMAMFSAAASSGFSSPATTALSASASS